MGYNRKLTVSLFIYVALSNATQIQKRMKIACNKSFAFFITSLMLGSLFCCTALTAQMQKLKIAKSNRFLVKEDGNPFVWIGETNWFFAKLPPAVIDSILDTRSSQGFTMMFVSCRERLYNGQGIGSISNPNESWWSYLDEYIAKCEQRNLYVGITLGWWGIIKNNTETELYNYGKWVGDRYKDKNNIVWLTLGETGSHSRKDTLPAAKVKALVNGIRDGDSGNKLLTIHADYKRGTSLTNDGAISDFNNWQTSQWCCLQDLPRKDNRTWSVWEAIEFDYHKLYHGKPKPTLDSEAWYENNKDFCDAKPYNIRRRAYFTIFAGAFGHTYGAGGIWDGLDSKEGCSAKAIEAIHYTGAKHMGYVSNFLHNLGEAFLKLRPHQSIIVEGNSDNYDRHIQATMSDDNSFALIYSASDAVYHIDLSKFSVPVVSGFWYNPRNNQYLIKERLLFTEKNKLQQVDPPGEVGIGNDWVLMLGDEQAIKSYMVPFIR